MPLKAGRRAHDDPPVEWKINLPTSLVGEIELLLADPVRGRTAYGARSKLAEQLFREWVEKQRRTNVPAEE